MIGFCVAVCVINLFFTIAVFFYVSDAAIDIEDIRMMLIDVTKPHYDWDGNGNDISVDWNGQEYIGDEK